LYIENEALIFAIVDSFPKVVGLGLRLDWIGLTVCFEKFIWIANHIFVKDWIGFKIKKMA
jgi:hypothetical protein